jgi:hypothetical protein
MTYLQGYIGIQPTIDKIGFKPKGKTWIELLDGRKIVTPLKLFPSIEKLSIKQRKEWQIIDGVMFSFVDCDEVYHVSQLLGKEDLKASNGEF